MKKIEEIIQQARPIEEIIKDLKQKSVKVPAWSDLEKEYNPKKHPVMTDPQYKDKVTSTGVEKVSRITLGLQRLAAKRMTELTFGIPVKRVIKAEGEGQKEVARVLEKIMKKNRIDSVNLQRGRMLFAGCEVITLWYGLEERNNLYGVDSPLKIRCKNYSPMQGDSLWPLFDEYDDMIALSFEHKRTVGDKTTDYFDTYTKDTHLRWERINGEWQEATREAISLGKIPAIYMHRDTPIWEDTSGNIYENEWVLSRNGNYLRKNSKPILGVFADEEIEFGGEKDSDWRSVFQYPKGSDLRYVTWPQAVESLKMQIENIYRAFFTELQLPDMSFENMKSTPMSGEARKMMFIDAHLKVRDESGPILEAMDREINVVKQFMKIMMPTRKADIDALEVEIEITPYTISDDQDTVSVLTTATAGKPIMSQREAVEFLGWSGDVEQTIKELREEAMMDITEPTL